MGSQKHTISLNGKLYNTTNGAMLTPRTNSKEAGKVLDGFFKSSKPTRNAPISQTGPAKKPVSLVHTKAPHARHHKTERSKTLLRSAVKKPADTKTAGQSGAILQIRDNEHRTHRAQSIPKSKLINRFGTFAGPAAIKIAPLPVRKQPARSISRHNSQAISAAQETTAQEEVEAMFNDALRHANSHRQTRGKRATRRQRLAGKMHVSSKVVSISAVLLAAVLLIGFFTYQNIASINVKVASSRASVRGTIPSYKPAGFSLSRSVGYSPGQITLNFTSTTDGRDFQISQQASNWNSETLLSSYVATNRRQSQTIEENGKTIYIYDGSNATWVDGGVWYRINGNNSLSSEQLLKLASSM